MFNIIKERSTHSSKLERWLGPETVEYLSRSMTNWYGPPIAIGGVPGAVFAHKGGDFRGSIEGGGFLDGITWGIERIKALGYNEAMNRIRSSPIMGFTSLSDLISEASGGKMRKYYWQKAGSTGVVSVTNSLWGLGPQPAAGANAAAAPGGESPTDATTGAHLIDNVSTDTRHIVSAMASCEDVGNSLLLYDRIFQVNKTMNSTATEAVTGVPTRYQSTTTTDADYIGGNFLFVEVGGTALAATAHNWTTCTYTDQANAASTLPSLTGNSAAIVRRLDHPILQWFAPLATGDVGVKALTQMQASALVATGVINFVIGHPLAWMPIPIANLACQFDYINTAFNLARIFDDAAMAFLEITKPLTSATTYNVEVVAVHG